MLTGLSVWHNQVHIVVCCTSRQASCTSLIIQWFPDSTDCFNKRQLSSNVARRTLPSVFKSREIWVSTEDNLLLFHWGVCICVLVTWLRCLAHNSNKPLYQHQAVGAPLLVRNWQLQPLQKIAVYTYRPDVKVVACRFDGTNTVWMQTTFNNIPIYKWDYEWNILFTKYNQNVLFRKGAIVGLLVSM